MSAFNEKILALPLGIVRAMHVEGGPEASLPVRGAARTDAYGSFETGFEEDDRNGHPWPIPNLIGVSAKR